MTLLEIADARPNAAPKITGWFFYTVRQHAV